MEKGSRDWGSIGAAMLLAVFATAPYVLLLRALTGHRGWYLLLVSAVALSMFLAHRRSRQRIWREFTLRFDPTGVWRRRIVYRCALRSPFDDVEPHLASPELTASWFPQHRLQVQGRSPQLITAPPYAPAPCKGLRCQSRRARCTRVRWCGHGGTGQRPAASVCRQRRTVPTSWCSSKRTTTPQAAEHCDNCTRSSSRGSITSMQSSAADPTRATQGRASVRG